MQVPRRSWLVRLLGLAFVAVLPTAAVPAATLRPARVVAKVGDPSPDGTDTVLGIIDGPVVLGASGQVAFTSELRDPSSFLAGGAILRGASPQDLTMIARSSASASTPGMGWPAPDGDGYLYPFDSPLLVINGNDEVAFPGRLIGSLDPSAFEGIFLGSGGQAGLVQIARRNELLPGSSDRIFALDFPMSAVSANDAGDVAFHATWGSVPTLTQGFLTGDGTPGSLTELVRAGTVTPDGTVLQLSAPLEITQSGATAFGACFAPFCADSAIYRNDGGDLTQIARSGDASPDGNGSFAAVFAGLSLYPPALDEAGEVAFYTTLTGTSGGSADDAGVFRGDGTSLVAIARRGDLTPGGNGRLLEIDAGNLVFDDLGQVLFESTITGASGGSTAGIFRGEGGALRAIARLRDPTPSGVGVFSQFEPLTLALNEHGQAVFQAFIDLGNGGDTKDTEGLFFFDDARGLIEVARLGTFVAGAGTVGGIEFAGGTTSQGAGASGLNANGEVAYRLAAVEDGNYYVVVADEPGDTGLAMAAGISLLLLCPRRRSGTTC